MNERSQNRINTKIVEPVISAPRSLLQRKCACGNHMMGGGECRECGKKRQGSLQTKLQVNEPGDVYEQEADRIANQVMATPAHIGVSGTPVRIQRFSGKSNGRMDAAPDSVDRALAGSGAPLEPALRQEMEQRFGHEFSRVRVHSGPTAEQSARDVNAHAYTVGHNIVFGAGQFAPKTQAGRRLIAHELTHVVQQSETFYPHEVRRLSPGDESFVIRGLPRDSKEQPKFVFFNLNDATIPESERSKITDFARENSSAPIIHLYGYASEEGDERENSDLIDDRLESVRAELNRVFGGDIEITRRPEASIQQIDYRRFRSVELSLGDSTVRGGSSNTETINCNAGQNEIIDTTREATKPQIDHAITELNNFTSDPGANEEVKDDLDNNFHSHSSSTVATLLGHLRQIKRDLPELKGDRRRQCATSEFGSCTSALALTERPQIIFCSSFFDTETTDPLRLRVLTHEMSHYALPRARDRAYGRERVLPFLSTAEALVNADSIAIFVLETNLPPGERIPSTLSLPTSDTVKDCGSNEEKAKEALAWAERWNTYALFGLSQTYSNWVSEMFPYITARLGPINRFTLAGIHDRYRSLRNEFGKDFTLECVEADGPACDKPVTLNAADRRLLFCPAFFSLSLHNRIVSVYAEITKLVPPIRDDQRKAYGELARDYKIHYWGLPPT